MKENSAFRILLITKKQKKEQTGFVWNFLKTPIYANCTEVSQVVCFAAT